MENSPSSDLKKLPVHLATHESTGLREGEPIAQFEIGTTQNFVYLILDWQTKTAAIVDPQQDLARPLQALQDHGFTLHTILLTHTHYDHVAGVGPLLKLFPSLQVRVGDDDLHRLPKILQNHAHLKTLKDGEELILGNHRLQALHTPGHSRGEFSYFLKKSAGVERSYLFTGDTIFIRDCGRTDFEDGSNEEMFASIQKIKALPLDTVFLVGHHYQKECATTLAEELESSGPFRCHSVQELAALP
jgi:glyoxylase-like metal-dependent hydrolase (beta-lactamase superfamily II)